MQNLLFQHAQVHWVIFNVFGHYNISLLFIKEELSINISGIIFVKKLFQNYKSNLIN